MSDSAVRRGALDGRSVTAPRFAVLVVPPAHRTVLRAGADALPALDAVLGLELPSRIGASAVAGERSALCLGPDEWLLIDPDADPMANLANVEASHSAVDVSHRQVGLLVTGEAAADALEHGCPRDLSLDAFPIGACARTVLGKVEVVLWRGKADAFRVECWRSFSTYAMDFLEEVARGAG